MNKVPGPPSLPKCEHGRIDFENCEQCMNRDRKIFKAIRPLADEFYNRRGDGCLLQALLFRAYRMGMKHQ